MAPCHWLQQLDAQGCTDGRLVRGVGAMTAPIWTDSGEPANVEAALMDSLLWLKELQKILNKNPYVLQVQPHENVIRLTWCIQCVEDLLKKGNP